MKFKKSSIEENKKLRRNKGDFFNYVETLFGQNISSEKALHVKQKGEILRKVKKKLSPKAKSELNITAWLLPQRHRLTDYYKSLPCAMNEKQKALAIRWLLERKFEENHISSILNDRKILDFDLTAIG